jgi:hypothetical protein
MDEFPISRMYRDARVQRIYQRDHEGRDRAEFMAVGVKGIVMAERSDAVLRTAMSGHDAHMRCVATHAALIRPSASIASLTFGRAPTRSIYAFRFGHCARSNFIAIAQRSIVNR